MQTAIAQAARNLPQGMDPPQLRKINPADSPILYLAMSAERLPLTELDAIADSRVAQRLSSLSGVAQVLVYGSQKYALRLYLDPAKLQQRGLTFADVITAVQSANANLPSGTLDGATRSYTVKAPVALTNAADFGDIIVAYHDGTALRVKDLGRAEDGVEDDKRKTWYNGTRAIVLAVQRQPGANTVEVADRIRAMLPQIESELPDGVRLQVHFDRSLFVKASLHEVNFTLMLALVLVILVIFAFLHNLRATLIAALVLPSSLLGTFAFMHLAGYSLNNLSLMAITLAIGFVVDDAVVVIENIARHLEMGKAAHAGRARRCAGDRLHGAVDDAVARCGVPADPVPRRHDRAAVPGIRRQHRRRRAAVRRGGADADADAVRARAGERRRSTIRCRACSMPDSAVFAISTAATLRASMRHRGAMLLLSLAVLGGDAVAGRAGQAGLHPARRFRDDFCEHPVSRRHPVRGTEPAPGKDRRHRAEEPGGRRPDVERGAARRWRVGQQLWTPGDSTDATRYPAGRG